MCGADLGGRDVTRRGRVGKDEELAVRPLDAKSCEKGEGLMTQHESLFYTYIIYHSNLIGVFWRFECQVN